MKLSSRRLIIATATLTSALLLAAGGWVLFGQSGQPIPTSLNAGVSPELTTINQDVTVRFTTPLPPGAALPLNVNLIRIQPSGNSVVIGTLNDNGTAGDTTAGALVYSAQTVIRECQPKTLRFQASASSVFFSNLALSGDLGSSPNEFLQVTFAGGISCVVIAGDLFGSSFTLDNTTFTPVPEPSTLSMPPAATLMLARRHRFVTQKK